MNRTSQIGNILIGFLLGVISVSVINLVTAPPRGTPIELSPPPSPAPIRVHVNGAINSPGVYTLVPGSIAQDAIDAAGGPTDSAMLLNINLASPLEDGELIYIYSTDEHQQDPHLSSTPSDPNTPKINVNTATASDLELLPGIGPSLAQSIVEFRGNNGPFETVEDLLDISGIGPAKLEEIKDYIVVR